MRFASNAQLKARDLWRRKWAEPAYRAWAVDNLRMKLARRRIVAALLLFASAAQAEWEPRFAQSSPQVQDWFRQQKNSAGEVCCDESEAVSVEDWSHDSTGYRVRINGEWYSVADKSLTFTQSITGGALAWIWPKGSPVSTATIRCFIPGPEI